MRRSSGWLLALAVLAAGCGKKGPPLPPLILLPAAPADFAIARRGDSVIVQFKVPAANSDGSTPADLDRVDVYVYSGPDTATPQEILARGSRVGSVVVNPPIDPDASQDEVDKAKAAAPEGGLDQGTLATVSDRLTAALAAGSGPRSYLAVGVSARGRRGPLTRRIAIPEGDPPPAPLRPEVKYNDQAITVTWPPVEGGEIAYRLYRVGADGERAVGDAAVSATEAADRGLEWDTEVCFGVRSQRVVSGVTVESELSPSACVTLKDTFPPAVPTGLQAVAAEGAVNLIWDPSSDADLAGYLVLRAITPETGLTPVNHTPITETTFRDVAPSGVRVAYAIQAVDKAGNRSDASARVEETPR